MRSRRIFKPQHRSPRRWGALVVVGLVGAGLAGAMTTGVPQDLLGRAVALPAALFETAPPAAARVGAAAAEVVVVDGETLRLGDRLLRLAGVVAPERGETCRDATGRGYDCGTEAAAALVRLVAGRAVQCRIEGRDRLGRDLGICHAGDVEIGAALVAAGWATAGGAADAAAAALQPLEAAARRSRLGLWSGGAESGGPGAGGTRAARL